MIFAVSSFGLISANNQACAFELDRRRIASISAPMGAGYYGFGALMGWILSFLPRARGTSMAVMIISVTAIAWLALRFLNPVSVTANNG